MTSSFVQRDHALDSNNYNYNHGGIMKHSLFHHDYNAFLKCSLFSVGYRLLRSENLGYVTYVAEVVELKIREIE